LSRHLTKREKVILAVCVAAVVGYPGYVGFIVPMQNKSKLLDGRIKKQEKKLRESLRVLRKADVAKSDFDVYNEKFKQNGTNEAVMSSIISEIEAVAANIELGISDMKPKRVKKEENFNIFSVSLTLDSEFVDVVKFLYILQKDPHYFDVEEIRFDRGSRRRKSSLKASLVLSKVLIPQQ